MRICEQALEHGKAVHRFNERLAAKGAAASFPTRPPNQTCTDGIQTHHYLAIDGEEVRGGYILIRHSAIVNGASTDLGFLQWPLSEGIIDPRLSIVGHLLLRDAVAKAPMLYALGMGGFDQPLPRMLNKLGFKLHAVPFFFRVFHTSRFLSFIHPLRTTPIRQFLLDALAATHLADAPVLLTHAIKARHAPEPSSYAFEEVPDFTGWADELWLIASAQYSLSAVRNTSSLNCRFPRGDQRLHRLRIRRNSATVGWVVVTDSQLHGHKHFGDMRLGALVDMLCIPGEESVVAAAGVQFLRERGVDLAVSNQFDQRWRRALRMNGFLSSASNFIFAASPRLYEKWAAAHRATERAHLNRGDGDGPIHL